MEDRLLSHCYVHHGPTAQLVGIVAARTPWIVNSTSSAARNLRGAVGLTQGLRACPTTRSRWSRWIHIGTSLQPVHGTSGWCDWNMTGLFSHLLGMSSSQLMESYFSEGFKPPTRTSRDLVSRFFFNIDRPYTNIEHWHRPSKMKEDKRMFFVRGWSSWSMSQQPRLMCGCWHLPDVCWIGWQLIRQNLPQN